MLFRSYTLLQDVSNIEAVGKKHYLTTHIVMGEEEAKQIDFKKIGQELWNTGKGKLTDYGILFKNEDWEIEEIYDGKVFPYYSYSGEELLTVEIEHNGKNEYLYLPDSPTAIAKAISRLGATMLEDCKFKLYDFNIDNKNWCDRLIKFIENENIYDVNQLVNELSTAELDLNKLNTAIKYAMSKSQDFSESVESTLKLAKYINELEYFPYVSDYNELGQKIIETSEYYQLSPELEEYFDYDAFAEAYAEEREGELIDGDFICLNEYTTLDEILDDEIKVSHGEIKQ